MEKRTTGNRSHFYLQSGDSGSRRLTSIQLYRCRSDKAFRLIEAGIRQNIGDKGSVYAGLRNIDMDHFTTPFTALFTNASHGNFPILSANFPLATYPLAALCLHTEFSPCQVSPFAKASTTAWPATVSTVSSVSAP